MNNIADKNHEVYKKAVEVFGGKEKALRWMEYPSAALGNIAPIKLIETSVGVQMLLDELGRIEHGIFA